MKANIILKDEVNCKVEGLDLNVRRKLQNEFSFMLPYAFHVPAFKLGRWDGKVNFFSVGGATYINLLERILPIVMDAGYEIEIDDRRNDYGTFKFPEISEAPFEPASNLTSFAFIVPEFVISLTTPFSVTKPFALAFSVLIT